MQTVKMKQQHLKSHLSKLVTHQSVTRPSSTGYQWISPLGQSTEYLRGVWGWQGRKTT